MFHLVMKHCVHLILDLLHPGFFTKCQLCIGWREEELQEKFQKLYTVLWRNPKITEIMNTPFTFPRTLVQDCRSICTRTGQLDPKVHFLSSYIMRNLIFFKVLACKTSNKFKLCSLKGLQDWKAFTLIDHCIPISKLISLESN